MPVRALRSSCNGILLKVTVPRKTIGQSSLSVAGPQMWNDLPIDVRSAQSLMMFRKRIYFAVITWLEHCHLLRSFIKTF